MICFVFQPSRDGKKSRVWSGRVRLDQWPIAKTYALGVSDKRVAQQKLATLVRELEREAAGISVPRVAREAMQRPLSDHIAAFLVDLQGKRRAHGTFKRYRTLLRVLEDRIGWASIRDIDPISFSTWRAGSGLAAKYLNNILGAALTFCTWLERRSFVTVNPLRHVEKIPNENVGCYRRALSEVEVGKLLSAAPPSRAWVYLTILYTGLRRHELNLLTWGHFHLDAVQPFVELPANITKNRKADRQPLRSEVVAALRSRMPDNSMPFEWVFRGKVPSPAKLRRDLRAAGIPAVDDRGRVVDVHALRTTFCTLLSVAGVAPRVAMELMRHSDLKLTMRIYTDAGQLPLAADVQRLPSFALPKHDAQIDAQIHSQTAVAGGVAESQRVASGLELANQQAAEIVAFSPAQSSPVASGEDLKMVGAVRFEPVEGGSQRSAVQDEKQTV